MKRPDPTQATMPGIRAAREPGSQYPDSVRMLRAVIVAAGLIPGMAGADGVDSPTTSTPDATVAPARSSNTEEARLASLRSLSLEDILHSEVTSVSKRPEKLFEAPAAIFVITGEDIQRSGVRSIAEALRLAPGLDVAQLAANQWAISARGFNDRFSDKLLVLVDGRTAFSPSASSVFWDAQDYLLEDIERIEVVRGPGGALWGANAVNGVVNIVTKNAKVTEGAYLLGGGGTDQRGFGGARYGAKLSEDAFVRGYVTYRDLNNRPNGFDGWNQLQGGARMDWQTINDHITLQGDYYHSNERQQPVVPLYTPVPGVTPPTYLQTVNEEFSASGGNALFRYEHQWSDESDLQFQSYYDRVDRGELAFAHLQEIFDVDFQQRFALPWHQSATYGLGYRYLPDHYQNQQPLVQRYEPASRGRQLVSAFVEDEITLAPERLRLTLGAKLEHNDFSGFQVMPNARLAWTPSERQTVWASVSRVVAEPGRDVFDIAIRPPIEPPLINGLPVIPIGYGSPVKPQELLAYELGYRLQPSDSLSFDLATFYDDYPRLVSSVIGTPFFSADPAPHLVVPGRGSNNGKATSYGAELSARWQATDRWRLIANYSFLNLQLDNVADGKIGGDPRHQASLRSSMDLPAHFLFDAWGRYTSDLRYFQITGWFDVDLRLAWRPTPRMEIAVVGQNLIRAKRLQFGPGQFIETVGTTVPRGVYGQVSLKF